MAAGGPRPTITQARERISSAFPPHPRSFARIAGMSIDDLVPRLVTAARAAFTRAREQHPDESFYCFALYTDAFAAYILPTASSEQGLERVARRYAEEFGGAVAERADDLRWSPADSPHHMLGEEEFEGVLDLLASRGDPWQCEDDAEDDDAEDDAAEDAEVDARFEACFRALAIMDQEGFFGRGAERDQVVVTVLQGDQSDRSRLANARRLNPPAAVARLERDLDVPEPIGDAVTLGSKGAYQITALAYAPRARTLVACGSGGELYAWDLDGDREILAATHDENYWGASISADGATLLVTDHKRVLRIGLPGGERHELGVNDAWTMAVAPDGATVAAARSGYVQAFSTAGGAELWRLDRPAAGLRFAHDGTLLAVIGDGPAKGVVLVDAADGAVRQELVRASARTHHCLAWSADDQALAIGDQETGRIRLWHVHVWDAATGQHLRHLRGTQESMSAIVFTGDGRLAAAGRDVDAGPPVRLWTVPVTEGSAR
jgi:hypothetical protein